MVIKKKRAKHITKTEKQQDQKQMKDWAMIGVSDNCFFLHNTEIQEKLIKYEASYIFI